VIEPAQHRRTQLMQPRERELHLGLDARRSCDAAAGRALRYVLQQRRLPDAGFTAQNHRAALARPNARDQSVQRLTLAAPTAKPDHRVTI
jgi:hypothetical protein